MNARDRERLYERLQLDEGLMLKPYRDTVGKLTIGYGRNLDDVGITLEEAGILLGTDMRRAEAEVVRAFDWYTSLDGPRQAVLVNMAFNLGIGGLLGFRRMIAAIERHDFVTAAREALDSRWSRQVGERSTRLAKQLRTGVFT